MRSAMRLSATLGFLSACLSCMATTAAYAQSSRTAAEFNKAGQHYFAQGDYDKAVEQFSLAIARGSNPYLRHPVPAGDLVLVHKNEVQDVVVLSEEVAIFYVNRGKAYVAQEKNDAAFDDFDHAISIWPSFAEAYSCRGLLWLARHDHDRAFADLDRAVKLEPKFAYAHIARAFARSDSGDLKGSLEDINVAIALTQKDMVAFCIRGEIYLDGKDR